MIANSVFDSRALSAGGSSIAGGSNKSIRALRSVSDGDIAKLVLATVNPSSEKSNAQKRTFVDIDAADVRVAGSEYAGHRVIFVLLVPKGANNSRFQTLTDNANSLISAEDVGGAVSTSLQVNVPASLREEILAGLARVSTGGDQHVDLEQSRSAPPVLPSLTRREREVLQMILQGHPNKNIAVDLGISMRTVENHRAKVMKKTGSKSLPALVRLAIAAGIMP